MAVTRYYSFGGEILAEETDGVRRDYLTDALGSVTATVTEAGVIENTYRYKPYGETLAKTGAGSDPNFLWNGKWGYRRTSQSFAKRYVRARHYAEKLGNWTTKDKLGFMDGMNLYSYVRNNSVSFYDRSGLFPELVIPTGISLISCLACMAMARNSAEAVDKGCRMAHHDIPESGNDRCNADKHCYWSCFSSKVCGYKCAKWFTDLHESPSPIKWNPGGMFGPSDNSLVAMQDRCMDLYNNREGFKCGSFSALPSNLLLDQRASFDCISCCAKKNRNGELQINDNRDDYAHWCKPPKNECMSDPAGVISRLKRLK